MQSVHGFAHHRNGSIAVAVAGLFPGDQHLGDRDQEGPCSREISRTCTISSSPQRRLAAASDQQRDTQRVLGEAQCYIVARLWAVCTASSIARTAESSARSTP